jgi:acetyl-CoA C-acetyltransferase
VNTAPILVGVGQAVYRENNPDAFTHPIQAMEEAVRLAVADAECPAILEQADALHVVNVLTWQLADGPTALADALDMHPKRKEYGAIGGNTPQWMVNRVADFLAAGESDLAVIAGCDLMSLVMKSMKRGIDVGAFSEGIHVPMVGIQKDGRAPEDDKHGAERPIQIYPLIENALRARQGLSMDEHRANLGRFGETFSAVAAENPYAWLPTAHTAEEVVTASAKNRMTAFPYTKYLNSCPSDHSAAVIMTTPEKARSLGIPESKWVYLHGGQDAHDIWIVGHRPDVADSPAIKFVVEDALDQANIELDAVKFFDLYSCFPCMPRMTCQMLGMSDDDPRPLTLTGGLPYFGGAGNNYTMHGIAEAVTRCREDRDAFGMVTSNGYYCTKHGVGIYGASEPAAPWQRTDPDTFQSEMDLPTPMEVELEPSGTITVDAYTVIHGFDNAPERGIICGRTSEGKRAWANTPPGDTDVLNAMEQEEWVGKAGKITGRDGDINLIEF